MVNLLIILLLIILMSLILLLLPDKIAVMLVEENGPIENAQVIFYMAGAIISWVYAKKRIWNSGLKGGFILMLLALRELDLQKRFTDISITRTKFYFSPDIAILTKIAGGIIVIGILFVVITFITSNARILFRSVKNRENWAIFTFTGIILLPVATIIDGSLRFLKALGIQTGENAYLTKTIFEETVELAIPVLFLVALLHWRKVAGKIV